MVNSKTRSVCHKLPYRVLRIVLQDPKDAPCRRACQIAWITNFWNRMTGRPMICMSDVLVTQTWVYSAYSCRHMLAADKANFCLQALGLCCMGFSEIS